MTRARVLVATAILPLLFAGVGHAQPSRPEVRAAIGPNGELIRLVTVWDKGARVRVDKSKPVRLHKGEVAGTVVTGHGKVVIALAVGDAREPFRVQVLDTNGLGEPKAIARPSKRHDIPFAVAAALTEDGFAVFFQEIEANDPSAARTYLVKLDKEAKPKGVAREVPVPWSLAAAAWNGDGYHLALLYPGDQRGMRLSMVSLSAAGKPEQHPDWASAAAALVADVHLVAHNEKIRAFYRGGSGGDRLLESDVTEIRSWGREPPKAKDRGALPLHKAIAISKGGKPRKVAGATLD